MEQVRRCNDLEILERFRVDSLKTNNYIAYHKDIWVKALSLVIQEQDQATDNRALWIKAYRGFVNFYHLAIKRSLDNQMDKLDYETQRFSEINRLTLHSNGQDYMNECQRMIPLLEIDLDNFDSKTSLTFKRWLTWGWFPFITFQDMRNTPRIRLWSAGVLRFLLAAMDSILKVEEQGEMRKKPIWQELKELLLLADKMGFPVWMWRNLLEQLPKQQKNYLIQIIKQQSSLEIDQPIITSSLSISPNAKEWEIKQHRNILKAVEKKDFHAIDQSLRYIESLSHWPNGFVYQLFGLAYHLDYYLAIQLLTPEVEPFTIYLVCNHPYYSTDLKFLMLLAEKSGHLGRCTIARKVQGLLFTKMKLSYRLLIYFYLYKLIALIIKTQEKKILNWIVEDLIPWYRLHFIQTKWIGRCLGHALAQEARPEQIMIFFNSWNPKTTNHSLDISFVEVATVLHGYSTTSSTSVKLLRVWNHGILQTWLKKIISGYKKGEAFGHDSETKLENSAILALTTRYLTNSQWLKHLNYLLKIWKRQEFYWNSDYQAQMNRKDSILSALVVVLYAVTPSTTENIVYSSELKRLLAEIHLIVNDKRLWQVDRIKKKYVKPHILNHVENASNELIKNLTI